MAVTAPSPTAQNRLLGISLRLGAVVSFGLMAAMIKLGHESGIHLVELAFYRFFFGLPPLLAWMALTGALGAWRTSRPLAHLWRGTIGLTTMLLSFSALRFLPLAEASTLNFVAPLFAVMLSALILSEAVGHHRWSAVALGLAGVVIVMQPAGSNLPPVGLILALLGALGAAGVQITLRQIGRTESTSTIVLWFTGFALLVSGLFLPFFGEAHDGTEWLILGALGLTGGVGQLFMTSSLRFAPVPVVVPFDYSALLMAVGLGWLIWDTRPPSTTWIGAAVIIASGLYTVYREHRLGKDRPPRLPFEA